jgi:exonuclease SbcC
LIAEEARYDQIASDLTDSRFVRYLLDEERSRLAALGSEHFERLSSGRYRFSENGKFDILDLTAADAERKADSLSGGETFLASLALALALAEMVARTGGRLDAFFLDEGFGSLDPEHLDLAMEGIEALVAGGSDRLVVVVSHVPEMRQRLEDLIILDRDPRTGDTKVMSA